MVKKAMVCDYKGNAVVLARAAKIIRRDIVSHKGFLYDGKLDLVLNKGQFHLLLRPLGLCC